MKRQFIKPLTGATWTLKLTMLIYPHWNHESHTKVYDIFTVKATYTLERVCSPIIWFSSLWDMHGGDRIKFLCHQFHSHIFLVMTSSEMSSSSFKDFFFSSLGAEMLKTSRKKKERERERPSQSVGLQAGRKQLRKSRHTRTHTHAHRQTHTRALTRSTFHSASQRRCLYKGLV